MVFMSAGKHAHAAHAHAHHHHVGAQLLHGLLSPFVKNQNRFSYDGGIIAPSAALVNGFY